MAVTGRGGIDLHGQWDGDARAYLGLTVPGFPNLFLLYGPNTNIVINGSIVYFSECGVQYVLESIRMLLADGHPSMECRPEVHDAYNSTSTPATGRWHGAPPRSTAGTATDGVA